MKNLIIFGTGKYAEVVAHYLLAQGLYRIAAFTVDANYILKDYLLRRPVLPFEGIEEKFPPAEYTMFVALGYQNLNELRAAKYRTAKAKRYKLISYVDPRAAVGGSVGDNCLILEHNSVQPTARIGSNVSLWGGNHIGHHSEVGDHCFLAGQVTVGGNTKIGQRCFIGMNATIGHGITVGRESFIGAGALITRDTEPGSVFIAPSTPKYRLDARSFLKLRGEL
jgi:sugar O-acyltransferase (sialic acid O-acetyltransferase NeuD family)